MVLLDNLFPIDPDVAARIEALDLQFNKFGVDPYGIDKNDLIRFMSAFAWIYRYYFKVDVYGIDNVPGRGRAILVGNHSGGVAIDGAMVMGSMLLDAEPPRLPHAMLDKFIHQFPGASKLMSRTGQFTGNPDQAKRLLRAERLILAFPEGARGTAKLAKDADSLVEFGTGFMRLALETKSPIVPFGFVGGGDALPTIANLKGLGRLFGVPYIPVTKWIVLVPKPTRFQLLYGKPLTFEGSGHERDEVVCAMVDQVKERIRDLIRQGRQLREKEISEEDLVL
ncbi:MAG: acyltransferase family protein [Myxococcales bacterium]|nr:acyltransferase family protein [Myxococcales bacterium]